MSNLTDEAREARNAYYKKYRAEHKDKVREANRKYWEKKRGQASCEKECAYCSTAYDEEKDGADLMDVSITQFPHLAASIWINLHGNLELWVSDNSDNARTFEASIVYCPMCGKRLQKNG